MRKKGVHVYANENNHPIFYLNQNQNTIQYRKAKPWINIKTKNKERFNPKYTVIYLYTANPLPQHRKRKQQSNVEG